MEQTIYSVFHDTFSFSRGVYVRIFLTVDRWNHNHLELKWMANGPHSTSICLFISQGDLVILYKLFKFFVLICVFSHRWSEFPGRKSSTQVDQKSTQVQNLFSFYSYSILFKYKYLFSLSESRGYVFPLWSYSLSKILINIKKHILTL